LDSLPVADRAAIARALSKDPEHRFPSCREMVEALREASAVGAAGVRRPLSQAANPPLAQPLPAASPGTPTKTQILPWDAAPAAGAPCAPQAWRAAAPEDAAPVRDLPPLVIEPAATEHRPTLIIGLGGLAASALKLLRTRLADRFPDEASMPTLQLLVLDTDPRTFSGVGGEDRGGCLDGDSAILLSLRPPAEYRRESQRHAPWLSRRWLYNIPRSLQTQGLRPLGRLAFVDHCERIRERIRRAITTAGDPAAAAAPAEAGPAHGLEAHATGGPAHGLQARATMAGRQSAPRIFVVSSTSGGSGGGMALDVGYLIRQALRELRLKEDGVYGILAHVAGRGPQARDLAVANTCAFLTELRQYCGVQGYPGDPSCGLAAFAAEEAPFRETYLLHLGEDLDEAAFAAAADQLAKYLYYNTVTPAGAFFDRCRAVPPEGEAPPADRPTVRSFGLCPLGLSYDDVPAATADELCRALVTRWRGAEPAEAGDGSRSLADPTALLDSRLAVDESAEIFRAEVTARMQAAEITADRVVDSLCSAATRELGADPESYLLKVLQELVTSQRRSAWGFASKMPPSRWILDALDTLICSRATMGSQVCLEATLAKRVAEMAAGHGAGLRDWILSLALSSAHRVIGAQQATVYAMEYLRALSQQASDSIQAVRVDNGAVQRALLTDKRGSCTWLRFRGYGARRRLVADRRVHRYFRLRIEELALNATCQLSGALLSQMAALADRLRNLAADLNCLAEDARRLSPSTPAIPCPTDAAESIHRSVGRVIALHKAEMVAEMEAALEQDFRIAVTDENASPRRLLARVIRPAAQATIRRTLRKIGQQDLISSGDLPSQERAFSLPAALEKAAAQWPGCGGDRRLLLVAPAGLSPAQLAEQLGPQVSQPPTVVADDQSDMLLCCEMERLPLQRLAAAVLDGRFHSLEVASRLHTRIDVSWLPL
jgi:hypothetical protein